MSSSTIDKPNVFPFVAETILDLFMRPKKILAHEDFPELFAPQTTNFLALCESCTYRRHDKIYSGTPRALEPQGMNLV